MQKLEYFFIWIHSTLNCGDDGGGDDDDKPELAVTEIALKILLKVKFNSASFPSWIKAGGIKITKPNIGRLRARLLLILQHMLFSWNYKKIPQNHQYVSKEGAILLLQTPFFPQLSLEMSEILFSTS